MAEGIMAQERFIFDLWDCKTLREVELWVTDATKFSNMAKAH